MISRLIRLMGFLSLAFYIQAHQAIGAPIPLPTSFSSLVKAANPAVVSILVKKRWEPSSEDENPFEMQLPFAEQFSPPLGDRLSDEYLQGTMGSGFIIDENGHILTTYSMIEDASTINVILSDQRRYEAIIVGWDTLSNLALILIQADSRPPPLALGDSDALQVGDWVLAIGNPFGLGNAVTCGIVSAKYRHLWLGGDMDFIQTDASINPGNNGGPLLNLNGQVVGINSAVFSEDGVSLGIGFAIPINYAKRLLPQLHKGKIRHSWVGVSVQDITPQLRKALDLDVGQGALVSQIFPHGPAARAGLRRGDVIVGFDGRSIDGARDLIGIVATTPVEKKTSIDIKRKGRRMRLTITTAEPTEPEAAADVLMPDSLFGLTVQSISPEMAKDFGLTRSSGVLITQVDAGSMADDAGLVPGDIIVEADQDAVTDLQTFYAIIDRHQPNEPILLLVDRDGHTIYFTIILT